jgi:predicted LPLAT superfamily acyltransferase
MSDPISHPSSPADWAQPKIGQSWQHRFFRNLMRVGGKARGYHMANIVSFWYVLFYPSIRRRCRFYLNRRFPISPNPIRRFLNTFHLVRNFAATLVDMMVLSMFGPASLTCDSPDSSRLKELSSADRGFILLQAHVGCWQVGMSTMGHLSKPISIVMIPEPKTTALFDQRVANVIDPRTGLEGVMQMTEALLRGEIVTMMGDRTFGDEQNTVKTTFLGAEAAFPVTSYRLASATGSPIVVMMAPRTKSGSYEIRLVRVIDVPPSVGRKAQHYASYARQFAECIEQFVQENPWQYYNFYDLWSGPPVSSPGTPGEG